MVSSARTRRLGVVLATVALAVAGLVAPADALTSGHVRGTVSVPKDVTFVGVEAYLYRKVDGRWVSARRQPAEVDSRGRFAVGGLKAGTYRLYVADHTYNVLAEYYDNRRTFETSTRFTVRRGHVTRLRPIRLARAAHIRGRLTTTAGRPARASIAALQRRGGTWTVEQHGDVGPDGRYDIGGLRAGTYRLSITDDTGQLAGEFWPNARTASSATSIVVEAGQTVKHKNARLERGSRISGTVSTDDGAAIPAGEVAGAFWWVDGAWTFAGGAPVRASGRYEIKGLAAGTYRVRFRDVFDDSYAEEFWDDVEVVERATDVVVPGASTVGGKDAVIERNAHVRGRVESATGQVLAGIEVTAHRPVPGSPGQWEVAATTSTTTQGVAKQANYRFRLVPGTYRFTFVDPTGAHAPVSLESAVDVDVVRNPSGWPPVTVLQPTP